MKQKGAPGGLKPIKTLHSTVQTKGFVVHMEKHMWSFNILKASWFTVRICMCKWAWYHPYLHCGHTWDSIRQLGWTSSGPQGRLDLDSYEHYKIHSLWSKHTRCRNMDSTGCHAVGSRETGRQTVTHRNTTSRKITEEAERQRDEEICFGLRGQENFISLSLSDRRVNSHRGGEKVVERWIKKMPWEERGRKKHNVCECG